ncbi:MAG: hypothetical protein GY711_28215 [bacterium]|nr:hypothetical protein [bacterium]
MTTAVAAASFLEGGSLPDRLQGGFGWLDWGVVLAVLIITTVIGGKLAGKQSSMRDFFLGGRKLPWYAVSASIVATEISAVTYVSLPSVVFKPGGDVTYLQLGLIGAVLARLFVGYVLVPAYYEREIYSPYDYMANKLGSHMRQVTTVLFTIGGILGQSARVYVTAVVLEVILHAPLGALESATGVPPIAAAVALIGIVAVVWTVLGGIATVVWTDAILFLLFLVGIGVALVIASNGVDGGVAAALSDGWDAGKFHLIDASADPTKAYTLWVALFAASWWMVGPYGTDQLMTQRLFCCKDARDARRAIVVSSFAVGIAFLAAVVGVALWAYYAQQPMTGSALELYEAKNDRVFPIFITEVIPTGLKGLVVAGVFAAAISSLDSIMAALSQTTMSAFILPRRKRELEARGEPVDTPEEARRNVRTSRKLVLVWAVLLCGAAIGMDAVAEHYTSILDLALAMATFTGGALLAGFFLAFLPLSTDGSGFPWAASLSVMTVFALAWHPVWAQGVCVAYAVVLSAAWAVFRVWPALREGRSGPWWQPLLLAALLVVILGLSAFGHFGAVEEDGMVVSYRSLAYPWYVPIGSLVAFGASLLLDERPFAGRSGVD